MVAWSVTAARDAAKRQRRLARLSLTSIGFSTRASSTNSTRSRALPSPLSCRATGARFQWTVLQESESSNDEHEREGAGEDEDENEEDAGDAAGDEEDELDETTLELLNGKVEMRRHKAQLEGLKKKDPDFFEYLQSASLSPGASAPLP